MLIFGTLIVNTGHTEEAAEVIHVSALNKSIDDAAQHELASFYLEILAKPGYRSQKPLDDLEEE